MAQDLIAGQHDETAAHRRMPVGHRLAQVGSLTTSTMACTSVLWQHARVSPFVGDALFDQSRVVFQESEPLSLHRGQAGT